MVNYKLYMVYNCHIPEIFQKVFKGEGYCRYIPHLDGNVTGTEIS
jgi:hypothetical protein